MVGIVEDLSFWISRFPEVYDSTWPLVDAIVFALIFVGLARVVFEKRFPGPGGKALIAGLGIALTIGMVWAEIGYAVSLKSFGPTAAGIVILVLAFMLFQVGQTLGIGKAGSLAMVVFLGLPLASQLIPELTQLIGQALPIVLILWMASGIIGGSSAFHPVRNSMDSWRLPAQERKVSNSTLRPVREELEREEALAHEERRETAKAELSSREILGILRHLRTNLSEEVKTNEGRARLNGELHRLAGHEHVLRQELEDFRRIADRLWREDRRLYQRIKVAAKHSADLKRARGIKQQVERELSLRQALDQYQRRFLQYDKAFRQAIHWAVAEIERNHLSEAERWIDHAIHWEEKAGQLLRALSASQQQVEKALERSVADLEAAA